MFSQFTTRYTGNPALKYAFMLTLIIAGIPMIAILIIGILLFAILYFIFKQIARIITFGQALFGVSTGGPSAGSSHSSQPHTDGRENVRIIDRDQ